MVSADSISAALPPSAAAFLGQKLPEIIRILLKGGAAVVSADMLSAETTVCVPLGSKKPTWRQP